MKLLYVSNGYLSNRSLDAFDCRIHNICLGPISSRISLGQSLFHSSESSFSGDFASSARICVALCSNEKSVGCNYV